MSNFPKRAAALTAMAITVTAMGFLPASAGPSERMKTACTSDYLQFCSQYDPDSFQTINCMKKNEKKISRACRVVVLEEGIPSGGARKPGNKRVASKQR